jgi:hypothetical protein
LKQVFQSLDWNGRWVNAAGGPVRAMGHPGRGRESAFETAAKSAIPRGFGTRFRGKFAGFPPTPFPLT